MNSSTITSLESETDTDVAIPAAAGGGGLPPPASQYRLDPATIDRSRCMARWFETEHKDRDWFPAMYYEEQCSNRPEHGSSICKRCQRWKTEYDAYIAAGNGPIGYKTYNAWRGLLTDDLLPHLHILGSAKIESKRGNTLKWKGRKV